ncbi:tail protein [Pseudomonas phage NV1]|uniref:Putative tail fiber protein n=1 Tax=Pseudomonas phage NV1 TaxID=2079543 RepID=A0A2L0HPQ9_9CAUD|nr:tail protein [Pseudomonas phage NV1]AUX83682.1 putative tail fiber protein [Pseudomonas phage NV1]
MGLETSVYIDGLVPSNPTGSDLKSFGDDHIRLIKQTLKNTFPNIKGQVTLTEQGLNQLVNQELYVKTGMIIMWTGPLEQIPTGWKLCNGAGSISNGQPVPNLVDRFPIGAGLSYTALAVGGSATHIPTGTVTVAGHVLTEAQMPSHTHGMFPISLNISTGLGAGHFSVNNNPTGRTTPTGGNEAHAHGATFAGTAVNHLPPYCGVFFIIKN